jgi:hypothetical protein
MYIVLDGHFSLTIKHDIHFLVFAMLVITKPRFGWNDHPVREVHIDGEIRFLPDFIDVYDLLATVEAYLNLFLCVKEVSDHRHQSLFLRS